MRQYLAACAHQLAAELARLSTPAPAEAICADAVLTDAGIRITVTISRISNAPSEILSDTPKCPNNGTGLREVERNILEAAPAPDGLPVSVKVLARLSGYSNSSYFRAAVAGLIERGLLRRVPGGVKLPPTN